VTQDQTAASLGAKLSAMDLTDQERSLLQATFQAALDAQVQGDAEVQGFEPTQAERNRQALLELVRSMGGSLGSIPLSQAGGFVKHKA
jgi:hypothetical protein